MNADGSNAARAHDRHPIKDQVPDWSPDGARSPTPAASGRQRGIWVMSADGSKPHQLSGCMADDAAPCAAGERLRAGMVARRHADRVPARFQATGQDDRPVFVMNADGSDQRRVSPET